MKVPMIAPEYIYCSQVTNYLFNPTTFKLITVCIALYISLRAGGTHILQETWMTKPQLRKRGINRLILSKRRDTMIW